MDESYKNLEERISKLQSELQQFGQLSIDQEKELLSLIEAKIDIENERLDLAKKLDKFKINEGKLEVNILKSFKERSKIYDVYKENEKKLKKLKEDEKKILAAMGNMQSEYARKRKKEIEDEIVSLEATNKMVGEVAGKWGAMNGIIGGVGGITDGLKMAYSTLKTASGYAMRFYTYFDDVDKVVREITSNMGLTSKQMTFFADQTFKAAVNTQKMGINVNEVIRVQESLSDTLGRNVVFTSDMLENIAKMAKGTGAGFDGISSLISEFDSFGFGVKDVYNVIGNTFKETQAKGLNISKVVKLVNENLKTAQKYNFKDGVKSLTKMSESAALVKLQLSDVFNLADKLFDVEGAVDLSAELQVLGGSFAKLADPFQLMYQARNDVEGLQKALIESAKNVAVFDKATGDFKIPAMELHRLRKVADATGISMESLTQSSLDLARQQKALDDIGGGRFFTETDKDAIKALAVFDKNKGKFIIPGLDQNLRNLDKLLGQKRGLDEAARERMTMMDEIKNLGNIMLAKLAPAFLAISRAIKNDGVLTKLGNVFESLGQTIANFVTSDKFMGLIDGAVNSVSKIADNINKILSGGGSLIKMLGEGLGNIIWEGLKFVIKKFMGTIIFASVGAILGGALGSLAGPLGVGIGASIGGKIGAGIGLGSDIGAYAKGGVVNTPLQIVGEKGPELAALPKGSRVYNNNQVGNMLGGNYNVSLNGTIRVDLGMGASRDVRMALLNDAEFMRLITAGIKEKTVQLINGTA